MSKDIPVIVLTSLSLSYVFSLPLETMSDKTWTGSFLEALEDIPKPFKGG